MFEVSVEVFHWQNPLGYFFPLCPDLWVMTTCRWLQKAPLNYCLLFKGLQMLVLIFISPSPTLFSNVCGFWPSTMYIKFVTEKWCTTVQRKTDFESSSELDIPDISVRWSWDLEVMFCLISSFILVFKNISCLSKQKCFEVAVQASSSGSYRRIKWKEVERKRECGKMSPSVRAPPPPSSSDRALGKRTEKWTFLQWRAERVKHQDQREWVGLKSSTEEDQAAPFHGCGWLIKGSAASAGQ